MSKVILGTTTTPTSLPGYPLREDAGAGAWLHTEKYWIAQNAAVASLPARNATTNQLGATITDPDSNQLYCKRRSIGTAGTPGVSEVTLEYSRALYQYRISPSDNPRAVNLRGTAIPIDDERLLTENGGKFSAANIATAKKALYTSLTLYGMEYTYTDTDASFAWTEENIISSLQVTGLPTGISSGTAANWRLIGKRIEEREDETIIESTYEYIGSGMVPLFT